MDKNNIHILIVMEVYIATVQILESLFKSPPFTFKTKHVEDLKEVDFEGSVPLFVRSLATKSAMWADYCRRNHINYFYYIDDNFFELPKTLFFWGYFNPYLQENLNKIITGAAQVFVNSKALESYFSSRHVNAMYITPFFDFSLLRSSQLSSCLEFRVGFAGGLTRQDDVDFLRNTCELVWKKYPDIIFEFCGVMPKNLEISDRARFFAHNDSYNEFISFLYDRRWSVGLAPLLGRSGDLYKTNNKFREYASCCILGIYSQSQIYSEVLKGEPKGYVLPKMDPYLWAQQIIDIYENQAEAAIRREAALSYAHATFRLETIRPLWEKAILTKLRINNSVDNAKSTPRFILTVKYAYWGLRGFVLKVCDAYKKGGVARVFSFLLFYLLRLCFNFCLSLKKRGVIKTFLFNSRFVYMSKLTVCSLEKDGLNLTVIKIRRMINKKLQKFF